MFKALAEAMKEFNELDPTKKWIVCFTNEFKNETRPGLSMATLAEKIARMRINLILVCYKLQSFEKQLAASFIELIKTKRPGLTTVDAFFCPDSDAKDMEKLFQRIANFKLMYD